MWAGLRDLVDQQDDVDLTIWGQVIRRTLSLGVGGGGVQPPYKKSQYSEATILPEARALCRHYMENEILWRETKRDGKPRSPQRPYERGDLS